MNLKRPVASQDSTVAAILKESRRPDKVPLRASFVQGGERGAPKPGPLATIVARGREKALDQYLLLVAWASHKPFDVRRDSRIWARGVGLHTDESGRSAVSRNWAFLKSLNLITVERERRLANITLLREDGSGRRYRHPGEDKNPAYLTLPFQYWADGYYKDFDLAAKAMLLIALSLPRRFPLPAERAPDWYGISESTARRGFRALRDVGLISVEKEFKEAPLAPEGYTAVNFYTLASSFGRKPRGRKRQSR